MVDDLKPELGCYGNKQIISPNINMLAEQATVYTAAYCQQAVCGPTRASLLTGLRPDKTKVWDLKTKLREVSPNTISLPQYLKQNGYYTIGMGKVFDPSNTDAFGDSKSWSVPFKKKFQLAKGYENIVFGIYQNDSSQAQAAANGFEDKDENEFYGKGKATGIKRYSTECLNVPDDAYMDGAMANYAVKQIAELKTMQQPFFLAIGFKKPHLPFIAPKKYWNLYKRESIDIAVFQQRALNSPELAYHNAGELRSYDGDIKSEDDKANLLKLSIDKQKELIHGYYACVSYIDVQIGKVIDALKQNGLYENTVIVLLGDHGWHLGDHSLWCKHSNFEQAVKVPLIIKSTEKNNIKKHNGLVEFVDLFPTICDITNLPKPSGLDGLSLVPTFTNTAPIKDFSISQYPRARDGDAKKIMGYSIRNKRYRLTEWITNSFTTANEFNDKDVVAIELYDYETDALETKNLATETSMQQVVNDLKEKLHNYYKEQFLTINKSR